jgi:hypothetical protein
MVKEDVNKMIRPMGVTSMSRTWSMMPPRRISALRSATCTPHTDMRKTTSRTVMHIDAYVAHVCVEYQLRSR